MKTTKISILLTLLGALLLCATAQVQAKVATITLTSPFAPLVMPMAYIVEKGLLDEVAEKTELTIWNTADQLRAMISADTVDFASVPSNVASIFYNKGVQLKMVNVSIWGVMYLVSNNPEVESLADLRGQTISIPFRGDQPDLIFQTICKNQGFDPFKDFQIQYTSSPLDITMGLLAGNIANALLIEPASSMVIMKGKEQGLDFHRVIDIQKELGKIEGWQERFANAGVAALPGIADQPEVVAAFAEAYAEAVRWSVAHPKEAAELAAKHVPGVNSAAFESALQYTIFEAVSSTEARPEMETMFRAFMEISPKSVGEKLPEDGFYYP